MENFKKIKIDDELFLDSLSTLVSERAAVGTHHVFVIDCSYSMYEELGEIRRDIANKMSTTLKENDAVSVVWFSGKGQAGIILEKFEIKGLMDMQAVAESLEKYLRPVGLTAFVDPMHYVNKIIERSGDMYVSVFFMTDGNDNTYPESRILKEVEDVSGKISSATVVEYGWNCNRRLLVEMAKKLGGAHIFSEGLQQFTPLIDSELERGAFARETVRVPEDAYSFFTVDDKIRMYERRNGLVSVPAGSVLYYLTPDGTGAEEVEAGVKNMKSTTPVYAAGVVSSKNLDNVAVDGIMKYLGDVRYIQQYSNAFGLQKITEFENALERAVFDEDVRYLRGYDPEMLPAKDAYCFLELISDLMSDEDNLWYPNHAAFKYKRTGAKMIDAAGQLTESEKNEITEMVKTGDFEAVRSKIKHLESKKRAALEFQPHASDKGVPFNQLTWNSKRANLSVQVCEEGFVKLPKERPAGLPEKFPTKMYKNYTMVLDGIIHTYVLPVSLSKNTFYQLKSQGLLPGEIWKKDRVYELDFSDLPVINASMVSNRPSARELAVNEYELMKLKASNKFYNWLAKQNKTVKDDTFEKTYGVESAAWLKQNGVMPYGFSPKKVKDKTRDEDEFEVPGLETKIKGVSSLPSKMDDLVKKVSNKVDLTLRESLFEDSISEWLSVSEAIHHDSEAVDEWIKKASRDFKDKKNEIMRSIAEAKFSILLGRQWFKEFKSRRETELSLEHDGKSFTVTFDNSNIKVKV